jgi:hypothetical protein
MELFCGYCGYYGEMVFVHSHYQCPRCKNNIAPCCEGENFQEPEAEEKKAEKDTSEDTETEE